jgi:hypothetical protein
LSNYDEESLIFKKEVVFTSPSNAAQNALGMNANGCKHQKGKSDGKTLDEEIRK